MDINKHVSVNQLSVVANNSFNIRLSDLTMFGLFPKFELSPVYSLLVQYVPRDGLRGYICSSIRSLSPDENIKVKTLAGNYLKWAKVFPWYYKIGWTIQGCYIRTDRVDTLNITYTTKRGSVSENYSYEVTINAKVDPEQFFCYMKHDENARVLKLTITNYLLNIIGDKLKNTFGNPAFSMVVELPSLSECERAGYHIKSCEIKFK